MLTHKPSQVRGEKLGQPPPLGLRSACTFGVATPCLWIEKAKRPGKTRFGGSRREGHTTHITMPADVSCKKMDLGVPIAEPLPASGFFGTPKRHETGTYLKGLPAKHIEMLFVLGCFPYFFSENSMGWDSKHSKKVFFFTLRASEDCQAGDVHLHLQVLEPDVLHLQGHGPLKELSAGFSDVSTFRPVLGGMCKRIAVNESGKWIYQRKNQKGL